MDQHKKMLLRRWLFLSLLALPMASAWSGTSILFIGNSFSFAWGSPVRYYRANTVTDLNHQGTGGVPALFKSFTDQAGERRIFKKFVVCGMCHVTTQCGAFADLRRNKTEGYRSAGD